MDVHFYLQKFESTMTSYQGDDPLEAWDKFVDFLDSRLAPDEKCYMSVVLERLVQTFLQDMCYHNDLRFIKHCIQCASYVSDPVMMYSQVHGHGVGTQSAALYTSWAQECEKRSLTGQAEQVYQKALENRAEPLDMLLHHYRLFQSRTGLSQTTSSDAVNIPLQDSQLLNQQLHQTAQVQPQCNDVGTCQISEDRITHISSHSKNNPQQNGISETKCVSMYRVGDVACEGSELSFEELRARRYFTRIGQQYRQQDVVSTPLQDSRLVNQQLYQTDRVQLQCNDVGTCQISEEKIIRTISRSENNPQPINSSETKFVFMYRVGEVVGEGSELSFEELRARQYFTKLRQQEVYRQQEEMRKKCEEEEQEVMRMKRLLTELNNELSDEPHPQQVTSGLTPIQSTEDAPHPTHQSKPTSEMGVSEPSLTRHTNMTLSQRMQHTLTLGTHTPFPSLTHMVETRPDNVCVVREEPLTGAECTSHTEQQHTSRSDVLVGEEFEGVPNTDVSHGGVNHSHVTPNTSLGLISATPSRVLPSPTVNTREALDLIGNMFQGPTLFQDSLFNSTYINTAVENDHFERSCRVTVKAASSTPFSVYQDENNENGSVNAEVVMKPKPVAVRALKEIPVSKANVTPLGLGSITDDTTVWGNGHAPMASFPNHTQDFALSAHLVSTPLHPITPYSWNAQHSEVESEAEENPYLRQPAKLSPILEQSPPEEKQCGGAECTPSAQGTIVGECVSLQGHTHSLTQHSQTNSTISKQALPPLRMFAPLPLADQSGTTTGELRARTKPSWSVYQSPDAEVRAAHFTVGNVNSSSLGENTSHHTKEELYLPNSNLLHMSVQFTSSNVTCLRDEVQSTSLQCHSNTELYQHAQNSDPEITSYSSNSNKKLQLRLCPEVTNSSSMNIIEELKPAHLHLNHSQLSDVEEADVLIPERSFNMRKSLSLLLENPSIHHQNSSMVPQSPDPVLRVSQDIPMSPDPVLGFGCFQMKSPVQPTEPDLDIVMKSPLPLQIYRPSCDVHSDQHSSSILEHSGILRSKRSFSRCKSEKPSFPRLNVAEKSLCVSPIRDSVPVQDVSMSPAVEPDLRPNRICPKSPVCQNEADLEMMVSPQRSSKICAMGNVLEISQIVHCDDDLMSLTQPSAPLTSFSVVISDPWDDDLIVSLIAGLRTPLTSYPNVSSWSSSVPSITPKLTVQMGDVCVRVDCVVGQGAFATVYQATDIITTHKLILKVQKPFNPWEFYINTQLNARVESSARHLYSQLHAAHLFTNGSVLLGELYTCGTLLNVVNLYKSRSEKVMPQPLVLYFSVCILDMVERLHAAHIIHADIKPDNFMLGERFLENKNLIEEDLEHGLVLIDFGQSIDMTLFPKGVQFTAHCMTSGFQCTEMLSGRPWTYQTDYFGIAGTVYCMLFGSYMHVRNDGGVWKTGAVFKRNPHSALWQDFFHVLLNVPDCTSLPSLRDLRERLSSALLDNYRTKLLGLKNRLVVQILESRSSRR